MVEDKKWAPDKTVVKSLGLMGFGIGCHISAIDIKDGKIIRIRPLHLDSQYTEEQLGLWEMKVKGKLLFYTRSKEFKMRNYYKILL